ncbi:MAG: acyl carrier protein [Candidatus Acidiferrum sp.]
MPDSTVYPALALVIAKHFRVDAVSITPNTTAMDVSGWDSMTHTLLLIHIEKEFRVRLDEAEGFQAANVGELAALIEKALRMAPK